MNVIVMVKNLVRIVNVAVKAVDTTVVVLLRLHLA